MSDLLDNLNQRIDHTALKPSVRSDEIHKLCSEAIEYDFYSVVVNPIWVKLVSEQLRDSKVKTCSVVGFPLGANRTDIKVLEAIKAVSDGAEEIDMVANIGWICSDQFKDVEDEIRIIRENIRYNIILKVIIETSLLTESQIIAATNTVAKANGQFVKSSTGFFGGATVEQIKIMSEAADGRIEVKASGGIKTVSQCNQLLASGASRLGCSCSVEIMQELKQATAK